MQVYEPAASPVAVAAVPPEGAHEYEYAGVPPLAETVAEPFEPAKQETLVCEFVEAIADGCVSVNVCVSVQVFASVTVHV